MARAVPDIFVLAFGSRVAGVFLDQAASTRGAQGKDSLFLFPHPTSF